MDVLYHAIVGFTIAKTLGGRHEVAGTIASITPDLIGTIPFYISNLLNTPNNSFRSFFKNFWTKTTSNKFTNDIDSAFYYTTHSLFMFFVISLFTFIYFRPAWVVVGLSYLSHILIDIPTHEGDFSTRFLYPFSNFHWEFRNWAKHLNSFFTFWGILIAAIIIFRFI
jgi:hypothetical protein